MNYYRKYNISVQGRMYPVTQYFLEDCVQLCKFEPPPQVRKRKIRDSGAYNDDDDDEKQYAADEGEDDMNKIPLGPNYNQRTHSAMSRLSEKDVKRTMIVFN